MEMSEKWLEEKERKIVDSLKEMRQFKDFPNVLFTIANKHFSYDDAAAIFIHLAISCLGRGVESDKVLVSWGLIQGFDSEELLVKERYEKYIELSGYDKTESNLSKQVTNLYYKSIAKYIINLMGTENVWQAFVKEASERYSGKDRLPALHFLEPPKEQKEPVEESIPQTPPALPPVPQSQKRKRMTKYERVQQRYKKYGPPKPCTKKEIVGITAVVIFAIILITAIGMINQNSVNEALASRAANSSDSTDYLLSRLQQDILVQEYKEAQLDEVKVRAENGDAEAQYIIGAEYYFNYEYEKATEWLLLSAEQDYASAQVMLCYQYVCGDGVKMDYDKALFWALRAAEQGNDLGQTLAGCCYNFGWGTDVNCEEAAKWYRTAAEQNEALALNNLGSLYFNGSGTEQSYSEALRLFKLSYDRDCSIAAYNIACMYQSGVGVEKDHDLAMEWLHLSAEGGYAPAQAVLDLYE